jgi:hypothetical protein
MLPQHVGGFQIYEDKLVTTAENLHIAYRVARLLALSDAPAGEADIAAVRGTLAKIKDSAQSLRDMKSKASQVKNLAEKIQTDVAASDDLVVKVADGWREGDARRYVRPAEVRLRDWRPLLSVSHELLMPVVLVREEKAAKVGVRNSRWFPRFEKITILGTMPVAVKAGSD